MSNEKKTEWIIEKKTNTIVACRHKGKRYNVFEILKHPFLHKLYHDKIREREIKKIMKDSSILEEVNDELN